LAGQEEEVLTAPRFPDSDADRQAPAKGRCCDRAIHRRTRLSPKHYLATCLVLGRVLWRRTASRRLHRPWPTPEQRSLSEEDNPGGRRSELRGLHGQRVWSRVPRGSWSISADSTPGRSCRRPHPPPGGSPAEGLSAVTTGASGSLLRGWTTPGSGVRPRVVPAPARRA
jgi:hypothetical protein